MCSVVVVPLDVKLVCKVDMPAGEAGWTGAEVLIVCPLLFAMVGPVAGIAVPGVDHLEQAPLPLGDRMAPAQGLVVEN